MKNIAILVASFLLVSTAAFSQQIQFNKQLHNFGEIADDTKKVSYTFGYTNSGTAPLIVSNVDVHSNCLGVEFSTDTVLPGQKGTVKVVFNPDGFFGTVSKSVTVYSNSIENKSTTLRVSAKVESEKSNILNKYRYPILMQAKRSPHGVVRANRKSVNYGQINNISTKTDTIKFYNMQDTVVTVDIQNVPKHIKLRVEPSAEIAPRSEGFLIFTYDAAAKKDFGPVTDRVYFKIKGLDLDYRDRIFISANIFEDFSLYTPKQLKKAPHMMFETETFSFDTISQGEIVETTFKFTNTGKSDLIVRKVKTSCGCTAGKLEKTEYAKKEDGSIYVKFNSRGKRGNVHQRITIVTNDPEKTQIQLSIKGHVKVN